MSCKAVAAVPAAGSEGYQSDVRIAGGRNIEGATLC